MYQTLGIRFTIDDRQFKQKLTGMSKSLSSFQKQVKKGLTQKSGGEEIRIKKLTSLDTKRAQNRKAQNKSTEAQIIKDLQKEENLLQSQWNLKKRVYAQTRKQLELEKKVAQELVLQRQAAKKQAISQSIMRSGVIGLSLGMAGGMASQALMNSYVIPGMKEAAAFERRLNDVAFVANVSGKEFDILKRKVFEFSQDSTFNLQQTLDVLYRLNSSGLSFRESFTALEPVQNLAVFAGSLEKADEMAQMLTATWLKFSKSTSMESLSDQMAAVVKTSQLTPQSLAPFMNAIGSLPADLNIASEEIMALGGALAQFGLAPAQSGHWLQILARRMVKIREIQLKMGKEGVPTKDRMPMFLRAMGMDEETVKKVGRFPMRIGGSSAVGGIATALDASAFNAKGEFIGLTNAVENFTEGLKKAETDEQRLIMAQVLFGAEAKSALRLFTQFTNEGFKPLNDETHKGVMSLKEYVKYLRESEGALKDFVGIQYQSMSAMWEKTVGVWKTVRTQLLGATSGPAKVFMTGLHGAGSGVSKLLNDFPAITTALGNASVATIVFTNIMSKAMIALFGFISAMSLTMWYTREVQTANIALTAQLSQFSKVLKKDVNLLLGSFGLSLRGIAMVLKGGLIVGLIGAIAYMTNLGGTAIWLDDKLNKLSLMWNALSEYMRDDMLTLDSAQKLHAAGMLGMFVDIVHFGQWAKDVFEGFSEGVKYGLSLISPMMTDLLVSIDGLLGTSGFGGLISTQGKTKKSAKELGQVLSILVQPLILLGGFLIKLADIGVGVITFLSKMVGGVENLTKVIAFGLTYYIGAKIALWSLRQAYMAIVLPIQAVSFVMSAFAVRAGATQVAVGGLVGSIYLLIAALAALYLAKDHFSLAMGGIEQNMALGRRNRRVEMANVRLSKGFITSAERDRIVSEASSEYKQTTMGIKSRYKENEEAARVKEEYLNAGKNMLNISALKGPEKAMSFGEAFNSSINASPEIQRQLGQSWEQSFEKRGNPINNNFRDVVITVNGVSTENAVEVGNVVQKAVENVFEKNSSYGIGTSN